MNDLLEHVEPDSCAFRVFVVWPDGHQTTYEGVSLTAEDVPVKLDGVAAEIRATLAHDAAEATEAAS